MILCRIATHRLLAWSPTRGRQVVMAEQAVRVQAGVASEIELRSEVDGFRLKGFRWTTAATPEAVVVLAHGAAEHVGRYERFAQALADQGFETWAVDHRGHGRSPGPKGLGDFGSAGWDGLIEDIAQVLRIARDAHRAHPLVLIGHSMGAFAAQHVCTRHSQLVDAVVLSGSTTFDFPDDVRELPLIDFNAGFAPARTPYDWLSCDPEEVDKYLADPFCGFEVVPPPFGVDDLRRLSAPEALANIRPDLPLLLAAGEQDPLNARLVLLQRLEQKLRDAGVRQIDTRYYQDARHEILNEVNRDEVTRDIIDWLKSTLRSNVVRESFIRYAGSR